MFMYQDLSRQQISCANPLIGSQQRLPKARKTFQGFVKNILKHPLCRHSEFIALLICTVPKSKFVHYKLNFVRYKCTNCYAVIVQSAGVL